jgi:hypothetical protein
MKISNWKIIRHLKNLDQRQKWKGNDYNLKKMRNWLTKNDSNRKQEDSWESRNLQKKLIQLYQGLEDS